MDKDRLFRETCHDAGIDDHQKAPSALPEPLWATFEEWFDLWDTTGDPKIRRLCSVTWRVARLMRRTP